ncbi:N(6)-adenine-specific DNA methyltransferase [Pseudomassariella vexata]|uniref:Protein-lysine N-methyltransferase EFM5 n=1 Tax=Pseudomassariella vexata TaxID=1141098 RepID=A0A1Y2DN71_9PEZI|nr:N(6)-adenine-specific DNA methyltransferase [Pseudomassariella vexata]ORY60722.1 N(6)-adenine-specific DNA methyltransferase [Pseudomassariella vexata]
MSDSDDEPITLSGHALDALKQFYAERDAHTAKFEKLNAEAEENAKSGKPLTIESFSEDWQESQFWYSEETASLLAKQLLNGATPDMTLVVVSAPSVFVQLRNLVNQAGPDAPKPKLYLLEHDNRFNVFGSEFIFYDLNEPFKLPPELKGCADRMICDPPFLNEDTQTKAALTIRWLAKPHTTPEPSPRLIVCTGERMEPIVTKVYKSFGLQTTTYEPTHARGLSNEFYCYANFEGEAWKWGKPVLSGERKDAQGVGMESK